MLKSIRPDKSIFHCALICRDMKWECQLNTCAPGKSANFLKPCLAVVFSLMQTGGEKLQTLQLKPSTTHSCWRMSLGAPRTVMTAENGLMGSSITWEKSKKRCVLLLLNSHCCTLFLLCCMNVIIPFMCVSFIRLKIKNMLKWESCLEVPWDQAWSS